MITELFSKDMTLETKRLVLRPIKASDAEDIFEIFSDNEVMKYYDLLPFADLSEAEKQVSLFMKLLKEKSMIRWGIEYKENRKLIGTCGFLHFRKIVKKLKWVMNLIGIIGIKEL